MHLVLCTSTHSDVADFINHGMVKTTKTWISWEPNITFLQNKKFFNLYLRWHILRSYCFVVEVTFRYDTSVCWNTPYIFEIMLVTLFTNAKVDCIFVKMNCVKFEKRNKLKSLSRCLVEGWRRRTTNGNGKVKSWSHYWFLVSG